MSAIVIYENDGTTSYTIGGTPSAGPFAIDYPWFFTNEIAVTRITGFGVTSPPPIHTLLEAGTDYTLTGVPADDGFHSGSVTLTPALANCVIRIDRTMRTDKASNFPETGAISIPGMNTLFSRLFSWIQDLLRRQSQLVIDAISGYLPLTGGTMTGHITLPTGPASDQAVRRDVTDSLQTQINLKAPIASPTLTGTPRSTTSLVTDAPSTRIATTGYVSQILGTRDQGDGIWAYGGTAVADPGAGNYRLLNTGGSNRTLSISRTDSDGIGRILNLLRPGDQLVFTSEVTPVTAYARYDITGTPTNNATWSQVPLTLSSMGSFPEAPAIGTRYRITGFLNTAAGSAPITNIIAGSGLTGGGFTGEVTLALASTAVTKLVSEVIVSTSVNNINVTYPAGAKLIQLHWLLERSPADMQFIATRISQAGVPVTTANYVSTNLVQQDTSVAGETRTGDFSWLHASASLSMGSAFFYTPYIGRASIGYISGEFAQTLSGWHFAGASPACNGFYFSCAAGNFISGSYVRCFAMT